MVLIIFSNYRKSALIIIIKRIKKKETWSFKKSRFLKCIIIHLYLTPTSIQP